MSIVIEAGELIEALGGTGGVATGGSHRIHHCLVKLVSIESADLVCGINWDAIVADIIAKPVGMMKSGPRNKRRFRIGQI